MKIKPGIKKMLNWACRQDSVQIRHFVYSEYLRNWSVSDKLIGYTIIKSNEYPFDYSILFRWKNSENTSANYLETFSPWWYGMIGKADLGNSLLVVGNYFPSYEKLNRLYLMTHYPSTLATEEQINYIKGR
jgi:hypothetical protein